ncbi:MAG: hypothetical protein C0404_00710 [Verrucomicrobia bacterium]|nr:hypothetical protein [Verrucomicrobiota bacterium]
MKRLIMMLGAVMGLAPVLAFGYPTWTQEHYRWRNDDNTEANATWMADPDVAIIGVTRGQNIRLRFSLSNIGSGSGGVSARPEFSSSASGPWTPVSIGTDGTYAFEMASSDYYGNGDLSSALLAGTGAFVTGRTVESPSNSSTPVTIANGQYSNFEYCFKPTSKASGGSNYYFRILGMNSYSATAQMTMAPGEANEAPVIRSALTANASCASVFSYRIAASGTEPITYGASGLPSGLSLIGNTITGTPAAAGTFVVGLTASNAYGSDAKTLTIAVVDNLPPAANDSSLTVGSGGTLTCPLVATDPEGQTMTYSIVSFPAHGSASCSGAASATYVPDTGFAGYDSFQWQASDGVTNSNVATVSITVTPAIPVPQNVSACVGSNVVSLLPAAFTGGGGYFYAAEIVTNAAHATVTVTNGTTFRYEPVLNYGGSDVFAWRIRYGITADSLTGATAIATCTLTVKTYSSDWPQWRYDESRCAATALEVPSRLYLQWRRDYPVLGSAWRGTYLKFDGQYEPVVLGKTMFVAPNGSGGNDALVALDTDTGAEKWRYYADAPIRLAPAAANGKVYFSSDDGSLYCLNATNGVVAWKMRGGPSSRKIFGNERLISAWPCRSGVMLSGDRLYFAAGLWHQEGTFIYCLDAATGAIIWKNDSASGITANMQHDNQTQVPAGLSPQGYPTMGADGWSLYVAVSRANPAILNRSTGAIVQYMQGDGGYYGITKYVGGGWWVNSSGVPSYNTPPVQVTVGSRIWTSANASALGVSGTPTSMLAADNRLFVVANALGSIYCYGGTQVTNPAIYLASTTPLPGTSDSWTTLAAQILSQTGNNEGCCFVAGLGTGRLAEELVKQTAKLHVVAIDPDSAKVAAFRTKMSDAGLYGTRCAAIVGNPLEVGLPPYVGRLIVSEDIVSAGFGAGQSFVQGMFRSTRPYGGTMWLITSESEHSQLASWVAAAGLANAVLTRVDGAYSRLNRNGALPGAANAEGGYGASDDSLVKAPLGMQWFGDRCTWGVGHGDNTRPDVMDGKMRGATLTQDIYTGLPLSFEARTGAVNMSVGDTGIRRNPFYCVDEGRSIYSGYGCGGGMHNYTKIAMSRSGAAGFYDLQTDIGTVHITPVRPGCDGGKSMVPANGVLLVGGGGCPGCNYPLTPSAFAMVHLPEVENWGMYSSERSGRAVESEPVHRLGINFGAPGERKDSSGTMWLHRPQRQSATPPFGISYSGTNLASYYHHASRIQSGTDTPWVAASGIKGLTNLTVGLTPESVVAAACAQPPVLDGYLTDSCWDGQQPVFMLGANAQVFLRKDATNLYIACRRYAATPVNWAEFSDAKAYWRVFLSDTDSGWTRYIHLSLSGDGTRADAMRNTNDWWVKEDATWEGAWTYGWRGGNSSSEFIVEFCVPWTTLTGLGINTNKLAFDVSGAGYYGQGSALFREYWTDNVNHTHWAPVGFDAPYGRQGQSRNYTVRMHFAETEGAAVGQRLFDVRLQGQTVLTDFDVIQQAGGADRAVIREFSGITALDRMTLELVPKTGDPIISGVEFIEDPIVTSIAVAPATAGVMTNQSVQFTATAKDQFGNSIASQPAFTWGVSGGGSINASGLFTAGSLEGGPYTVTATAPSAGSGQGSGKSGTASITVSSIPSGLLAWWKLDETTGTSAMDASGNGHEAALQSGAAWTTSGKIDGALQLSGGNDMMLANPVVSLTTEWTISAWFTAPLPATATWHTLMRGSGSSGDHQIITDSGLILGMYDNTSGGQFRSSGFDMGSLSAGWHHIAAVGTGTETKFYIDGVLAGTSDRKGSGDVYAVGNYQGNGQRFSDKIDDFRVYDHALTATEVSALANPGSGVDSYGIPDSWKVQYFGSAGATNAGAMVDADGDVMSNLAEYIAGTCPTNAGSVLRVQGSGYQDGTFGLTFLTVTGRLYSARYCDNLLAGGWGVLAPSNIAGTGGMLTITDTNRPTVRFYRLGVRMQ